MSHSPHLSGMSATFLGFNGYGGGAASGSEFAPASFADAEDARPISATFDIGGHAAGAPYSTALQAMLSKQAAELRAKADAQVQIGIGGWKKRLREFLTRKHGDLLAFLDTSVPKHPTLSAGELLIRRFTNPAAAAAPQSHPSVRDLVLDCSGEDVLGEINAALATLQDMSGATVGVQAYAAQTRLVFEEYRAAGEAIMAADTALAAKLDHLDRIQGKLGHLFEIEPNEQWGPLVEATEAYLEKVFADHAIETDYRALVSAYRRFAVLREILLSTRLVQAHEQEPLCTICLTNQVSYCLVPCGHTLCGTCTRRQGTSCCFCRAAIRERVKMYLS